MALRAASAVQRGARFPAKHDGECDLCGFAIDEDEPAGFEAGTSNFGHAACADEADDARRTRITP